MTSFTCQCQSISSFLVMEFDNQEYVHIKKAGSAWADGCIGGGCIKCSSILCGFVMLSLQEILFKNATTETEYQRCLLFC